MKTIMAIIVAAFAAVTLNAATINMETIETNINNAIAAGDAKTAADWANVRKLLKEAKH